MKISLISPLLFTAYILTSCSSFNNSKLDHFKRTPDSISVISKIKSEHYSSEAVTSLNNKSGMSIWIDDPTSKPNEISRHLIEPTGIGLAKATSLAEREAARILGSAYKAKSQKWFLQKAEKVKSQLGYYYLFTYDTLIGSPDKHAFEDQLQLIIFLDGTILKTLKHDN